VTEDVFKHWDNVSNSFKVTNTYSAVSLAIEEAAQLLLIAGRWPGMMRYRIMSSGN